jgi:hypothetical protein
MDEAKLLDRLRLIEALHAGATSTGERVAAAEARRRIQERLATIAKADPPIEFRFSLADGWSRKLFVALCRRYDVDPYRYRGQRRTTLMVRAPKSFVEGTLWPEFEALSGELRAHLEEVTDRLISSAIHADVSDVTEVAEPARLAGRTADD